MIDPRQAGKANRTRAVVEAVVPIAYFQWTAMAAFKDFTKGGWHSRLYNGALRTTAYNGQLRPHSKMGLNSTTSIGRGDFLL